MLVIDIQTVLLGVYVKVCTCFKGSRVVEIGFRGPSFPSLPMRGMVQSTKRSCQGIWHNQPIDISFLLLILVTRNKDKQRNMPPLPSSHLCFSLAGLQSLHCTPKSVPWVKQQWWCRRPRLVCSGYFAFAFPCFLPSGSGRVFSVGCSPLRAVPSVPSLPLLRQLLWAGAWLG